MRKFNTLKKLNVYRNRRNKKIPKFMTSFYAETDLVNNLNDISTKYHVTRSFLIHNLLEHAITNMGDKSIFDIAEEVKNEKDKDNG